MSAKAGYKKTSHREFRNAILECTGDLQPDCTIWKIRDHLQNSKFRRRWHEPVFTSVLQEMIGSGELIQEKEGGNIKLNDELELKRLRLSVSNPKKRLHDDKDVDEEVDEDVDVDGEDFGIENEDIDNIDLEKKKTTPKKKPNKTTKTPPPKPIKAEDIDEDEINDEDMNDPEAETLKSPPSSKSKTPTTKKRRIGSKTGGGTSPSPTSPELSSAYTTMDTARHRKQQTEQTLEASRKRVQKVERIYARAKELLEKALAADEAAGKELDGASAAVEAAELNVPCDWNSMYKKLKKFYELYGHSQLTGKGTREEDTAQLVDWCDVQRKDLRGCDGDMPDIDIKEEDDEDEKKVKIEKSGGDSKGGISGSDDPLLKLRRKLLDQVGFVWNWHDARWKRSYRELLDYKEKYGNCMVSTKDKDFVKLSGWVLKQRRLFKNKKSEGQETSLTAERIKLLEEAGFEFHPHACKWQIRYEELIKYKEEFGDCLVPQRYEPNPQLGVWVRKQQEHFKIFSDGKPSQITPKRIDLLNSIGFVWKRSERRRNSSNKTAEGDTEEPKKTTQLNSALWHIRYQELVAYKSKYGDCCVPMKYDENPPLAHWVRKQQEYYRAKIKGQQSLLTPERIKLLDDIGFSWQRSAKKNARPSLDGAMLQEGIDNATKQGEPKGAPQNKKDANEENRPVHVNNQDQGQQQQVDPVSMAHSNIPHPYNYSNLSHSLKDDAESNSKAEEAAAAAICAASMNYDQSVAANMNDDRHFGAPNDASAGLATMAALNNVASMGPSPTQVVTDSMGPDCIDPNLYRQVAGYLHAGHFIPYSFIMKSDGGGGV